MKENLRKELHEQVWDYAIKHNAKPDSEWWEAYRETDPYSVKCSCFACGEALDRWKASGDTCKHYKYLSNGDCDMQCHCKHCPIQWPEGITCDDEEKEDSLWIQWEIAKQEIFKCKAREIAQAIRALPWNPITEPTNQEGEPTS